MPTASSSGFSRMISAFLRKVFRKLPREGDDYLELERILGYSFRKREILATALSHRSYVNSVKADDPIDSNERMEFLGDAVLNIIITDYLFHTYPSKQEGRMSKMKSLVVSSKVLAMCAAHWDLGRFIHLSRSEAKSGGRNRSSILSDAYEAVLGAVYLDGGLEAARRLVHGSLIKIMDDVLADEELVNYKSKLLEFTQSRGLGVPGYVVIEESGPEHRKHFVVGVMVQGEEWGRGSGLSKKSSEQSAARDALERRDQLDGAETH